MKNTSTVSEPLLTEIFNETFARVSASGEFDAQTLTRLRTLAAGGGMQKAASVALALKSQAEEPHEDSRT